MRTKEGMDRGKRAREISAEELELSWRSVNLLVRGNYVHRPSETPTVMII